MIYFFIFVAVFSILFLILFLNIGLDINKNDKLDAYLIVGFIKIKISNKKIKKLFEFKSEGIKKDISKVKNTISKKPFISKILSHTIINEVEMRCYEDVAELNLTKAYIFQNVCYFMKAFFDNTFLSVKKEEYKYFLASNYHLTLRMSLRIKVYRMVILFIDYSFKKIRGGKTNDKSRRISKN